MKKMKCSGCLQVLGVPRKFFGKKVTCPNCQKVLVVKFDGTPKADLSDSVSESPDDDRKMADELDGPGVESITVPTPRTVKTAVIRQLPRPASMVSEAPEDSAPMESPQSVVIAPHGPANLASAEAGSTEGPVTEPSSEPLERRQQVARIIPFEQSGPEAADAVDLPTLQLKETASRGPKLAEQKRNPVLLGVLVCGSLIVSGLILAFGDIQPKVDQRVLENARQELTRYYSVRVDVPLKPYQIHLREAQLANSRGDRDAEVAAYRKVMQQFRAEDRNQFVGVTGSPTADAELEHLVSIMLGN